MPRFSSRVLCCWPVELWLWSSSWEGRNPVGLEEGGFAAAPLFNVSAGNCGVLGGSNTPKASCHSLLNSSLAPGPGLKRSLRKAMSPRSTSSPSICSIVPVCRVGPERKIAGSHKERDLQRVKAAGQESKKKPKSKMCWNACHNQADQKAKKESKVVRS